MCLSRRRSSDGKVAYRLLADEQKKQYYYFFKLMSEQFNFALQFLQTDHSETPPRKDTVNKQRIHRSSMHDRVGTPQYQQA